jgi:DNA polymerase III subunit gamma/tau
MGNVLYRKYRSKKLSDIIGQDHITKTLDNALKQRKFAHAYLFTGPKGVGKTSIARILAHEINQLPYEDQKNHLDIIEFDAASRRKVEDVSEFLEKIHSAPTQAPYKIYIIDEVHMLSGHAFNAFLKTLEEPPAHVIFILATTEVHKLPETVVSRTQRYTFRPIGQKDTVEHLRAIANEEKIDIADSALELLAEHSGGSFRDAISLLDQVRFTADSIDHEAAARALGLAPDNMVDSLFEAVTNAHVTKVSELLRELYSAGYLPGQVAKQLSRKLRSSFHYSEPNTHVRQLELLRELIKIGGSYDPGLELELVLLGASLSSNGAIEKSQVGPVAPSIRPEPVKHPKPSTDKAVKKAQEPNQSAEKTIKKSESHSSPVAKKSSEQPDKPNPGHPSGERSSNIDGAEVWKKLLDALKGNKNTLYGLTRMVTPRWESTRVVLECKYPFHAKRLSDSQTHKILTEEIARITGASMTIECEVADRQSTKRSQASAERPPVPADSPDVVATVSNIFGGAEVLES